MNLPGPTRQNIPDSAQTLFPPQKVRNAKYSDHGWRSLANDHLQTRGHFGEVGGAMDLLQ